jgi:predicted nuclease of predicted toxin-antitoxin system
MAKRSILIVASIILLYISIANSAGIMIVTQGPLYNNLYTEIEKNLTEHYEVYHIKLNSNYNRQDLYNVIKTVNPDVIIIISNVSQLDELNLPSEKTIVISYYTNNYNTQYVSILTRLDLQQLINTLNEENVQVTKFDIFTNKNGQLTNQVLSFVREQKIPYSLFLVNKYSQFIVYLSQIEEYEIPIILPSTVSFDSEELNDNVITDYFWKQDYNVLCYGQKCPNALCSTYYDSKQITKILNSDILDILNHKKPKTNIIPGIVECH